jgi:GTP-binding protein HflX
VPDALFISAHTGAGLDTLETRLVELIADAFHSSELLIPHDRYDVVARLHTLGHIQEQEHREDGIYIRGRFPPAQSGFFAPFVLKK